MELFKLFGTIFIDNDDANKSISKTEEKAEGLSSKLGSGMKTAAKWGAGLAAGAATAAAGAVAAATHIAAGQETAFAQVKTLLDASSTDYDKYKNDIRAASSEMGVAFDDYAEAVYSSISAGQDQADAIEFTKKAVMLAGGGFTSTANAVDVMTTALNAYGLESSEASNISDMLITTQNLGKTTVDELSASMGKVIPIAQAQGVEFDQLAAGYAVLTKNGVATAEAGTGMKAMLGELGKAGSKTDKILREQTGKSFSELSAEGKTTGDVLQLLQEHADKSGLKLSDLFGSVQAGGAALTLATNGGAEFDEFLQAMGDSSGATENAFNIMADTVEDKMNIVKTSLVNMSASIGDIVLPHVSEFLDLVIENMPLIQSIVETAFDVMSSAVSVAMDWISQLVGVIKTAADVVVEWVQANSGAMDNLTSSFQEKLDAVVNLFTGFFDLLKNMWESWGSDILTVLQSAWDLIVPVFQLAFDLIADIFNVFAALFRGDWEGAWSALGDLLVNAWDNIVNVIEKALKLVEDILVLAWNVITDIITVALDFIETTISGAWDIITGIFESVLSSILGIVGLNFDSVMNVVSEYMDLVGGIIGRIWEYIKQTFQNFLKIILALVTGDFQGLWQAIKDQMDNVKTTIEDIWGKVMTFFKGIDLKQIGIDIITGLISGVTSMAKNLVDSVKGVVGDAIEGAKNLLGIKSPSRVFMQIGEHTGEGLIIGIGSKVKAVARMGKQLAKAVIQPVGNFAAPVIYGTNDTYKSRPIGHPSNRTASDAISNATPTINQVVNIHSPKYLDPAETARLQKRAAQELALGF